MKWADQFCNELQDQGIKCVMLNRVNGWLETVDIAGQICFIKSATFNASRPLYFQGIDPSKMQAAGDYVLICGGFENYLRDIFIIPWDLFFQVLAKGEAINTYKPPKEYWQYKLHLREDRNKWIMQVQGGERPQMDVSNFRYTLEGSVNFFHPKQRP